MNEPWKPAQPAVRLAMRAAISPDRERIHACVAAAPDAYVCQAVGCPFVGTLSDAIGHAVRWQYPVHYAAKD